MGGKKSMRKSLFALPFMAFALIAAKPAPPAAPAVTHTAPAAIAADPANRLNIELSSGGTVVIQLRPDVAPQHVYRIQTLASQGFYNGLIFHRVIPGFMAQGGDPQGTGTGGSSLPNVQAEFSNLPHMRGVLAMARTADDLNGGNSQFFIMLSAGMSLDNKYSILGRVISGMQFVDGIAAGEPPDEPTKMVRVWIDGPLPASAAVPAAAAPAPAEAKPSAADAGRRLRFRPAHRPDRAAPRAAARFGADAAGRGRTRSPTARCSTCPTCCVPTTCWCSTTRGSSRRSSRAGAARRSIGATLHKREGLRRWWAFVRNAKRVRDGDVIDFGRGVFATAIERDDAGAILLEFGGDEPVEVLLERAGTDAAAAVYRLQARAPTTADASDYQTMFAREAGAVAAPTAALHFTDRLVAALDARGIARETLTLHVGAGTFLPVKVDDTADHQMHAEWGRIDAATADRLNAARARGGRLIAVGTTSLRLIESAAGDDGVIRPVRRRHRDLHHPGLSLQGGRRAADQLPPAAIDPVHAGLGADGAGRR